MKNFTVKPCEHNTPEWWAIKGGKPSASVSDMIMTASTLKPSAQQGKLIIKLAAQSVGLTEEGYKSKWMDRGHELEQEIRSWFALNYLQPNEMLGGVGVLESEDGRWQCSPDAMVGVRTEEGLDLVYSRGLEVKAPIGTTMVAYSKLGKTELPREYVSQVRYSVWLTGLPWSFMAYHPGNGEPRTINRQVDPDSKEQKKWESAWEPIAEKFLVDLDTEIKRVKRYFK